MQREIFVAWMILAAVALLGPADAAPFPQERQVYLDQLEEDPQALYELLTQFNRIRELENSKRAFGLDFGLNRGYSGSQAAKHMMGIAAANYANGPGRRRRSEQA